MYKIKIMKEENKKQQVVYDDDYLRRNIEDAKKDHDKACNLYRDYVGSAKTREERQRRITLFRCGGYR